MGGTGAHSSGDLFLVLRDRQPGAAANVVARRSARHGRRSGRSTTSRIGALFDATVEATEEAIVNALVAAETMTGRDGITAHALPARPARRDDGPLRPPARPAPMTGVGRPRSGRRSGPTTSRRSARRSRRSADPTILVAHGNDGPVVVADIVGTCSAPDRPAGSSPSVDDAVVGFGGHDRRRPAGPPGRPVRRSEPARPGDRAAPCSRRSSTAVRGRRSASDDPRALPLYVRAGMRRCGRASTSGHRAPPATAEPGGAHDRAGDRPTAGRARARVDRPRPRARLTPTGRPCRRRHLRRPGSRARSAPLGYARARQAIAVASRPAGHPPGRRSGRAPPCSAAAAPVAPARPHPVRRRCGRIPGPHPAVPDPARPRLVAHPRARTCSMASGPEPHSIRARAAPGRKPRPDGRGAGRSGGDARPAGFSIGMPTMLPHSVQEPS